MRCWVSSHTKCLFRGGRRCRTIDIPKPNEMREYSAFPRKIITIEQRSAIEKIDGRNENKIE